jgi:aminopeptidase N
MVKVDRLYDLFQPSRYELTLEPNKNTMRFKGKILIHGKHSSKQNSIRLHTKKLNITHVSVNDVDQKFELIPDKDELKINLEGVAKDLLTISIEFKGQITKPMHGLYPCFTQDGTILLATQFESHHAREVFPCIDEPEAKAIFSLTLTAHKNEVVLANTEPASIIKNGELQSTTFQDTPYMSTYLLAFIIGELHAIHGTTKNGTKVSVWSSKDHPKKNLTFALDTAIRATEFFNDYFDTPYPLTKCDHVALPDFSSGAMENWGLITYREVCLLVDAATTSTSTKEYVATVIAHELSHQWFGNLVTMKWWDDLWLNESFATLMEYIAVDALYPEWDIMLSFASQEALSAFWRDSLPGVQAVRTGVNHPDEISTLFDPSIVYAKGARLLLMAHDYVGKNNFKKGLRHYFEQHSYSNTTGNDLWQSLEIVSGKKVKDVMNKWIEQSGFPLLTVNQEADKIKLSQVRFSDSSKKDTKETWPIPLGIKPKNTDFELLTKPNAEMRLDKPQFVRFNKGGLHYSVRYENPDHRAYLKSLVKSGRLNASERLFLLNDTLMQARTGHGSIAETLDLLDALSTERQEPVWGVISLCMSDARVLAEENKFAEAEMKKFAWKIAKFNYEILGWQKNEGESLNDTKLRGIILGMATYSEEPSVIKSALKEFNRYKKIENIPADTRHIILSAAVRHGSDEIFDKLIELYPTITNADLRQDVCNAITGTRNKLQAKQSFKLLKNSDFVRLQDFDRWVIFYLRNRKTRELMWKWLVSNWTWIAKNFGDDKSYDHFPRHAGRIFATEKWLKEYNDFFGPMKNEVSLKRNIEIGVHEITSRILWRKRDTIKLEKWLSNNE